MGVAEIEEVISMKSLEITGGQMEKEEAQILSVSQPNDDPAVYVITPVSNRTRYFRTAISSIPLITLSVLIALNRLRAGTLSDTWFLPLILLAVGVGLGYLFFQSKEIKVLAFEIVRIPLKYRAKRAVITFVLTIGACSLFWWMQYYFDQLQKDWWVVWPFALVGFSWCAIELSNRNERVLTAAAKAEEMRKTEEMRLAPKQDLLTSESNDDLLYSSAWYIRYPIGVVLLLGVFWFADSSWLADSRIKWLGWVFIVLALLSVAIYARELVLLILACGALYLLILGLASLPISIAIIIGLMVGATIIANAIRK